MLNEKNFKQVISIILISILFFLAILIIKPLIMPILFGILLAYLLHPTYKWFLSKFKNPTLSAFFVCLLVFILFSIPLLLIINSLIQQIASLYIASQNINLVKIFTEIFHSSSSNDLFIMLSNSITNFISKLISSIIGGLTNFILNIPTNLLKLFVVLFVFFFALRDGEEVIKYIKTLSPLNKDTEKKLFKHFKDVTYSVLVGQVIIGIFQGLVAGVGYFIFGVPNALLLTIITTIVGIIPLIGPWFVWVPVDIYLFSIGKTGSGIGLLIYGSIVISWIDTFIRPILVSKKTKINSSIVIIGMIGGLFVFGILGLIIGPLILIYVLLIIEIYRKSKIAEDIIFSKKDS